MVLDSLESGYAPAVGDAPLGVGDIADDRLVASIVAKEDVDAVVHFAGYKAAGESMRQPGRYFVKRRGNRATAPHAPALRGRAPGVFVVVRGVRDALGGTRGRPWCRRSAFRAQGPSGRVSKHSWHKPKITSFSILG